MSKKKIEIALTSAQWVEVYFCLNGKITRLQNGEYGKGVKRWIKDLADISDEIECKVEV
jgi:hypothetical protein